MTRSVLGSRVTRQHPNRIWGSEQIFGAPWKWNLQAQKPSPPVDLRVSGYSSVGLGTWLRKKMGRNANPSTASLLLLPFSI